MQCLYQVLGIFPISLHAKDIPPSLCRIKLTQDNSSSDNLRRNGGFTSEQRYTEASVLQLCQGLSHSQNCMFNGGKTSSDLGGL